jgi:hypothetical protein
MNKFLLSCASSIPALTMSLMLVGCGSASFQSGGSGGSGNTTPRKPGNTNNPSNQKLTSLTWYWQCNSDPGAAPETKEGDVVLNGEGDHEIAKESMGPGVPMTIGGRVCPPEKYPRDIVFVIDVSGSMIDRSGDAGRDRKSVV